MEPKIDSLTERSVNIEETEYVSFSWFFVQSHDVLDVETIYIFSCVNILNEITEVF